MEVKHREKRLSTAFIKGGGEMGNVFKTLSWKETSLGDPREWHHSLKATLNILFNSNFPSLLFWGGERICFFNNSYRNLLNEEIHPISLFGKTSKKEVSNNFPVSQKIIDDILSGLELTKAEDRKVVLWIEGEKKHIDWTFHYSGVSNDNDETEGVLITCNEIADLENSVCKLNLVDQQFKNLIHQATVGIVVLLGDEMRIHVVNEMYGKLIGRTVDELQGKKIFSVIPEAENYFRPIIDNVTVSGDPKFLYETPYCVLSENEKIEGYLNLICQPYKEFDGSIIGVMILCHDVTHQVKQKKKIFEDEERFRLANESADLGTYEINLVTDEMITSERFNMIWGVERGMPRKEFASRIHPDDLKVREKAHLESLETGNLHYEARVIWKDKSHHWVKVKGKVLYEEDGKPLMLLGVIQDITEQKVFADKLGQLVQERTEALQALNGELVATNEELSESNTHLLRANRELEQFAYVSSHDLQEPLRKILVFTNILNQRYSTELSQEALTYLEKVSSSASRMASLIKDLLDYSRLNYNSSLFRVVDLNEVLLNVVDDYELLIKQKKIEIKTDPLHSITAIPIQMNQLFYNLIGNGIKFSKKGNQPQITITSKILSEEEVRNYNTLKGDIPYQEITISDNGIGFSQDYGEQIFTIFQRLNDKSKYGGYGIGLALCRRIVENHNGIIFAKGEENIGAQFVFILPVQH